MNQIVSSMVYKVQLFSSDPATLTRAPFPSVFVTVAIAFTVNLVFVVSMEERPNSRRDGRTCQLLLVHCQDGSTMHFCKQSHRLGQLQR